MRAQGCCCGMPVAQIDAAGSGAARCACAAPDRQAGAIQSDFSFLQGCALPMANARNFRNFFGQEHYV